MSARLGVVQELRETLKEREHPERSSNVWRARVMQMKCVFFVPFRGSLSRALNINHIEQIIQPNPMFVLVEEVKTQKQQQI